VRVEVVFIFNLTRNSTIFQHKQPVATFNFLKKFFNFLTEILGRLFILGESSPRLSITLLSNEFVDQPLSMGLCGAYQSSPKGCDAQNVNDAAQHHN
jgi:hypothetical protein